MSTPNTPHTFSDYSASRAQTIVEPPYQTTGMSEPLPAPAYKLHDAGSVAVATLLGAPAAGAILMALNYRRLGEKGLAVITLLAGFLVTALLVLLGYVAPNAASTGIGIGLLIAMRLIASKVQGPQIAEHVRRGGKLASKWVAAGVGLLFLVVLFLAVFIPVYMNTVKNKVIIGTKDEVYYTGDATKEDAQKLGAALVKSQYFSDKGTSVFLDKGTGGTTISLVQKDGVWDQPGMLYSSEEVAREVAPAVGGFPVKVNLINSAQDIKKRGLVGRVELNKDEVLYFGTENEATATALGKALQQQEYFTGRGTSVLLSKDDGPAVLSFVVSDGFWNDPVHVTQFEALARALAPSIGGLPLNLRLVNTTLEPQKEVVVN
jgi:hypothetical protein